MFDRLKQMRHRRRAERDRPLPYPLVKPLHYRPNTGEVNFGDELAQVIVHLMLAERGMTVRDEARSNRTLFTIGSILHLANDGEVVWGSGINGKTPEGWHRFQKLDVRAVRGPRTREFLMKRGISVPETYGDPGFLVGEFVRSRIKPSGRLPVAFVPNLNDMKSLAEAPLTIDTISPLGAWHEVIRKISEYRYILASSLHGIVLAEALGIPARYVRLTEHESPFKYLDYFEGTGRFDIAPVTSVEAALEMGRPPVPQINLAPLKSAFPYDLWLS